MSNSNLGYIYNQFGGFVEGRQLNKVGKKKEAEGTQPHYQVKTEPNNIITLFYYQALNEL